MTAPDQAELRAAYEAAAAAVRGLCLPSSPDRLDTYPLPDVLLWGLSDGCQDPLIGILGAAREIVTLVCVYLDAGAGEVCIAQGAIEGVGRRLDVALELLKRVRRGERRGHDSAAGKDGAP